MAWSTVYIRGRDDFQSAIISKLEGSWIQGSSELKDELIMFWLPESATLRGLKAAIGSKLILKYRLRFITNLNNHIKSNEGELGKFSGSEKEMIGRMKETLKKQHDLRKVGT